MKGMMHLQRALWALCLLYLSSCSETCQQWTLAEALTCHPCYNSGRMYLLPESDCHHLELELDRGRSGIRMYLNLLLLPAQPYPGDPNRTTAQLIVDGEVSTFYPYCFSGGQRLLIPEEITQAIIENLSEGEISLVKVGYEEIRIVPNNFEACYQRLMQLPIES